LPAPRIGQITSAVQTREESIRFPRPGPRLTGGGRAWFLALLLGLALPTAAAEAPDQKLRSVEKALDESREKQAKLAQEAEQLGTEVAALRTDTIAAAHAAQLHEAAIAENEEQLGALAAEERGKSAALKAREAQQVELVMALQRLVLYPPEAALLAPEAPLDRARGALLLSAAVPLLEAEARALATQLAGLASVRRAIEAKKTELGARRRALATEQSRLAGLIAKKASLQARTTRSAETTAQRLALLSTQAADLRDLIERLAAERRRRDAEERRRAEEAQRRDAERLSRLNAPPRLPGGEGGGRAAPPSPTALSRPDPGRPKDLSAFSTGRLLLAPVAGRLARRWGEPDELGISAKGLSFATQPGAQVVAPFDGRVEFAGPFRGYGQILIIEHGDGYHSLLAGLERIDGTVGQWLVTGEPVGVMKAGDAKPSLYLELRRNGQPINPLPWLAPRDEKVSG
jgi:septal ring factor EnvC (AmiA/AmiB activator)